jgi:hypothetical protein
MSKGWYALGLFAMLMLGLVSVRAEEGAGGEKKRAGHEKKAEPKGLMTVDEVAAKIAPDTLTDDQKTKIQALCDELKKQWAELSAKDEVKKVLEEMEKAKGGEDKEAMRTLRAKLKEVTGGFDHRSKFKEGLAKILTAEQVAKVFPPREKRAKDEKGEAKDEAKTE